MGDDVYCLEEAFGIGSVNKFWNYNYYCSLLL